MEQRPASGRNAAADGPHTHTRVRLDPTVVIKDLERCEAEDRLVHTRFEGYPSYFCCAYDELFPSGARASAATIDNIARWLNSSNAFDGGGPFRALSALPLSQTIENFDEIAASLSGTRFEYCLHEENGGRRDPSAHPAEDQPFVKEVEVPTTDDADALSGDYYGKRPSWVTGSLSFQDAQFLFRAVTHARADRVIELGTASGFSTGLLCHALHLNHQSGNIGSGFEIVSYDWSPNFYADPARRVGDAAREQLPAALLKHITFRHPAVALNVARDYPADSIGFMFIDANHRHPWPALDLFAVLDALRPGATVLLHDINLPLMHPEFQDWGVKYLFDELETKKDVPQDGGLPNIGRIVIPEDKTGLRAQLLDIIFGHEWQDDPRQYRADYLEQLGIEAHSSITGRDTR
jgi:predicted O-methyltransferase YrrM